MSSIRSRYIDLLKKCLLGAMHDPRKRPALISRAQCAALLQEADEIFKPYLASAGHTAASVIVGHSPEKLETFVDDMCLWLNGMHRDLTPDTMTAPTAVENVQFCVEEVIRNDIPGDLIETGIWKGGLPVLMRGILKAYDISDRVVWAADSFEGLPRPDPAQSLEDAIWFHFFTPLDGLKIPYDYVTGVFDKYDLLDDQVKLLRGWFNDTLPGAPIHQLAVMRLDGDWYESTRLALEILYPKLSPGGFAIIDDYGLPLGCRKAVDGYRAAHGIVAPIQWVNHQVAFWKK